MRLWIVSTISLLLPVLTLAQPPLHKRDADFLQVRKSLTWDRSARETDPPDKYFHEAFFHPHYDGRFGAAPVPYKALRPTLVALVQTYLHTMRAIGVATWLMHGSLLGWWWNGRVMPWDSDVDVQVSLAGMRELASFHNMTVHRYPTVASRGRVEREYKEYLLEVNPHWVNASTGDRANVIDARWVDMDTGLFIDVTTLRVDEEARGKGVVGAMMGKDRHHYLEGDVFPLRCSTFEGAPVSIPYAYADLLIEEYGSGALTDRKTMLHRWDQERKMWVLGNKPPLNAESLVDLFYGS